jgi:hypothetical protein
MTLLFGRTTVSSCYRYDQFLDDIGRGDQIKLYWHILGRTWQIAGVVALLSTVFSILFFLYTTSFCCSAQVLPIRYLNGIFLSVFLELIQGSTFVVFGSNFCDENGCSSSRSAGFSVGAILCFFFAGMAFLLTSDYPGDLYQPPPTAGAGSHSSPTTKTVPPGGDVIPTNSEYDGPIAPVEAPTSDPEVIAQRPAKLKTRNHQGRESRCTVAPT